MTGTAFFFVDAGGADASIHRLCAELCCRYAKRLMPHLPVVHLTDEDTPIVAGADEVRRRPLEPMALLRVAHHAALVGEWLLVDSDVVIQRDVSDVFARPFDVAITTRNWAHLRPAVGFAERMPFNVGVVFSRQPKFWRDVYDRVSAMSPTLQEWMGDQQAICDMVGKSRFEMAFLKGSTYNFPPAFEDSDEEDRRRRKAAILHFKGAERKALMLAWGAQHP